jgi:hypothetical protein
LPEKARAEFDYYETSDEQSKPRFLNTKDNTGILSQFTKGGPAGGMGATL